MARSKAPPKLPKLRVHKRSGHAWAYFSGKTIWFGKAGEPATQRRYESYLAEWLARGRKPAPEPVSEDFTVDDLVSRYLKHLAEGRPQG